MSRAIATVFGLGYLQPAPGTWASAAAIVFGLLIDRYLGAPALALAVVFSTIAGFWAISNALQGPNDDPSEFVIDEVAGQWLALFFLSASLWLHGHEGEHLTVLAGVVAFAFFRLFDIWKPWIIGQADSLGGARGVMLDDLIAGVFAGLASHFILDFYHIARLL